MVRIPGSTIAVARADGPPQPFAITTGSGGVLFLHGELDLATAPRLEGALRARSRRDHAALVVDLSDLDFSSCAGLAVLLAEHYRRRAENSRFLLVAPTRGLWRTLVLTGADAVLDILPAGAAAA